MARHRVPGEEPVERGGISPIVPILTVAALVIFTVGVVWAAVGKSHVTTAPPVGGASALIEHGRTTSPISPFGTGPATTVTPVVPHGPNVQIGDPSGNPSGVASARLATGTTATMFAPRPPRSHTTPDAAGLTVTISTSSWYGWYSAHYVVTNHTSDVVHGWTLTVTFKAQVADVHVWSADESHDGSRVTLTPLSYNNLLKPGESASFGLQATGGNNVTPVPVSCTLNGQPCRG